MTTQEKDESVGELLGSLVKDSGVLMRQELQLASRELMGKARRFVRSVALIAIGGSVALAALVALVIAAIAALAVVVPVWAAGLLVAAACMAVAYAVVNRGVAAVREIDPVPERSIASLGKDVAWVKEQVR